MTGCLFSKKIDNKLKQCRENSQFRNLNGNFFSNQDLIDFSSNDYLGLANHPLLKQRASQFLEQYGTGAKASRLVIGSFPCVLGIEDKIASLKGKESALVLNTGYQANLTLLSALTDKDCVVFADRLCHHSLIMGIKLGGAKLVRYRHNDLDHLEELQQKNTDSQFTIIVTESIFGMDGDCSDLDRLIQLKRRYKALLYVDEAHATGVLGSHGRGLAADRDDVDLVMGTFSKALGSFGAYVACSQKLKDYFTNTCGGLIYSTALPPPILGAIDAALELFPTMEAERCHLFEMATRLRSALIDQGWNCGKSSTHIIPIIVGQEGTALALSENLKREGILAIAIRPPTVSTGQARLRISLSSSHSEEDITALINTMKRNSS